MVDLAVGVIIGAAFGKIVESLVGDIIMPIIGAVIGGLDFSQLLRRAVQGGDGATSLAEAKKQGAVLAWGNFITIVINFLIVAWVLFLVVKGINTLRRKEAAEAREARRGAAPGSAAAGNPRPAGEASRPDVT